MKLIGVEEFGGPENLKAFDVPEPHAGPGEVRIRVRAATVNPTDLLMRQGGRDTHGAPPPYAPGMDAAGVVDEVGEGAPWQVGDELMAIALPLSTHGGAYVEHLVGPWESMTRVPAGADLEAASTLPMNGLTALQILRLLDLAPGSTLAVTGSAGILGTYLIPLAKLAGLTVIADTAEKDRELVTSLGADLLVERGEGVAARIRAAYPDGVDALADLSVQKQQVVAAVRDGGAFVSVRGWQGEPERGIRFLVSLVSTDYRSQEGLVTLRERVEDGALTLRVADVLPAEQAADAHRRLDAGGVRGRIVLAF